MRSKTGERLIEWLKVTAPLIKVNSDLKSIGERIGVSAKTISSFQKKGSRGSTEALRVIRKEIIAWPNAYFGIFLVDELLRERNDRWTNFPWPIYEATRPDHLEPAIIVSRLLNSEPSSEFLLMAANSIDTLHFDGHTRVASDVGELIWQAIYAPAVGVPANLIPAAMVYARLLAAQGRYQESLWVIKMCLNAAFEDGDPRIESFVKLDLLSVTHKTKVINQVGVLDEEIIKEYIKVSDEFEKGSNGRQHESLIWPCNYGHRGILVLATRSIGPFELTEERKDLIRRYAAKIGESSKPVSHIYDYGNANNIAECHATCATGDIGKGLGMANELLKLGQKVGDTGGLLHAKVTAYRRLGDFGKVMENLELCEILSKEVDNLPSLSRIRLERRLIMQQRDSIL